MSDPRPMSDLEDDVLMQLIEMSKKAAHYKEGLDKVLERDRLLTRVWKDLDQVLRAILRDPKLAKFLDMELAQLKKSVVAVLDYDKKSGPDASPLDRVG